MSGPGCLILYRDIVARHQVRTCDLLERLVLFVSDSVGSLVSARRISNFLKSQYLKNSPRVVLDYIDHLIEACFLYQAPRYDIKGKRVFEVNEKYYFGDLGLRNAIAGYRPGDINKILENIVYHHLRAQGNTVKVGVLDGAEVDFIAERQDRRTYYQVTYLLPDEDAVTREFGNLAQIPDQYPKYVISMGPMALGDYEGIRHLHLRDFLSGIGPNTATQARDGEE